VSCPCRWPLRACASPLPNNPSRVGHVCVCVCVVCVAGTPAYTPEEEKRYRTLLALLRSNDVAKQIQSLKTLHQMSRQGTPLPHPLAAGHGWLWLVAWLGVASRVPHPRTCVVSSCHVYRARMCVSCVSCVFNVVWSSAPTHDAMRQLGLLQAMLAMLKPVTAGASSSSGAGSSGGGGGGVGSAKHPLTDYESVMVELTKVVANLAANNGNRQVMGESGAIRDILRLLQDLPSEEIRENLLRTIMNLSIAAENEDRIREEGGLTLLLELLQADDTSPTLLLQTVRVLVNLSCNGSLLLPFFPHPHPHHPHPSASPPPPPSRLVPPLKRVHLSLVSRLTSRCSTTLLWPRVPRVVNRNQQDHHAAGGRRGPSGGPVAGLRRRRHGPCPSPRAPPRHLLRGLRLYVPSPPLPPPPPRGVHLSATSGMGWN